MLDLLLGAPTEVASVTFEGHRVQKHEIDAVEREGRDLFPAHVENVFETRTQD